MKGKRFLISFLGTFSTGKTTLVKALREELKRYGSVEVIYGGTRLVRNHGIRISEEAGVLDQAVLTLCTVERLLSAYADFILVDEHLLLHLAYGEALGFDVWFLRKLKSLSDTVYRNFYERGFLVLNFLLPLIPLQETKFRSKDVGFRLEVQKNLEMLVVKDRFGFYEIAGSYSKGNKSEAVADRVSQVLSLILACQVK